MARVVGDVVAADEYAGFSGTAVGDERDFEKGKEFYPITAKNYIKKKIEEDDWCSVEKIFNEMFYFLLSNKGLYRDKQRKEITSKELYSKLLYYLPEEEKYTYNEKEGEITFVFSEYRFKKDGIVLRGYHEEEYRKIKLLVTISQEQETVGREILNDLRLKPGKKITLKVEQDKEGKGYKYILKVIKDGNNEIKSPVEIWKSTKKREISLSTCHGDLQFDNILISHWESVAPTLWLIDFPGTHREGPTAVDLARLEVSVIWQLLIDVVYNIFEGLCLNGEKEDKAIEFIKDIFGKIIKSLPYGIFNPDEEYFPELKKLESHAKPELCRKVKFILRIIGLIRQHCYNMEIDYEEYLLGLSVTPLGFMKHHDEKNPRKDEVLMNLFSIYIKMGQKT